MTPQARLRNLGALVALVLLATACSSTKVARVEHTPLGRTKLNKWVVVAVAANETNRMRFERVFARKLRGRGNDATAGVDLFGLGKIDESEVSAKVELGAIDAGIVTTLTSQGTERQHWSGRPPGAPESFVRGGFYADYDTSWDLVTTPGYTLEREVLRLQTVAYDLKKGREVWRMTSKTFSPNDLERVIDEVTTTAVERLAKDGITQ